MITKKYMKVKDDRAVRSESKKNMPAIKLISKVKYCVDN